MNSREQTRISSFHFYKPLNKPMIPFRLLDLKESLDPNTDKHKANTKKYPPSKGKLEMNPNSATSSWYLEQLLLFHHHSQTNRKLRRKQLAYS